MDQKAIWKFELPLGVPETVEVDMPDGAQMLSAINQREKLVVYAMVNPKVKARKHKFRVIETGEEFKLTVNHAFVGTVSFRNGDYIVHVFETERW